MQRRPLGTTGLETSILALGAGGLGDPGLDLADADRLLDRALELGIALIDTAPSYGDAEERIGRWNVRRDARPLLSTKVGYGIPDVPDWTAAAVTAGVERACRRLAVEAVDVVHLHSCPLHVLQHHGVVEALNAAVAAGKVRVAAYSGEGEALDWAIASGAFGLVQCSLNVCDQRNLRDAVPAARQRGLGVLGKRTLANAPWRFDERPAAPDVATYWERWRTLGAADLFDEAGIPAAEALLRFALHATGADACLLGTSRPGHLTSAATAAEQGPLPDDLVECLRERSQQLGPHWEGTI